MREGGMWNAVGTTVDGTASVVQILEIAHTQTRSELLAQLTCVESVSILRVPGVCTSTL